MLDTRLASANALLDIPPEASLILQARSVRAPMPENESDLPNIDDLQIAAGAAAGKKDPVWPVLRKALGEGGSSEEDEEEQQTEDDKAAGRAEQPDEEMQDATSQVRGTAQHVPNCVEAT